MNDPLRDLKPTEKQLRSIADDILGDVKTKRAIPGFEKLWQQAGKKLAFLGVDKKFCIIEASIMDGKIWWIPKNKRVKAVNYLKLRMAGIELSKEQIRALGLEKDYAALDKLVEFF